MARASSAQRVWALLAGRQRTQRLQVTKLRLVTTVEEMTKVEEARDGARSLSRGASRLRRDAFWGPAFVGGIVLAEVAWLGVIAYTLDRLVS
jgi:hypothetical protein